MPKTRKMTIGYWNSLSEGSRKRALTYCFPIHKSIVDMLLQEKPSKVNDRRSFWYDVFKKVRIPSDTSFYKTVVNNAYLA